VQKAISGFAVSHNAGLGSYLDECRRLPVVLWSKSDPNRNNAERYLSWLSLLPLRLNPAFIGRRSSAD
jgi:hypothetical protein